MIVQVIGLPCSGKSFLINKYIYARQHLNITHLDITKVPLQQWQRMLGQTREKILRNDIMELTNALNLNIIVESACGVTLLSDPSSIIKIHISLPEVYQRLEKRDGSLDENYLSLLTTQMIKPHFVIQTEEAFFSVMDSLLQIRSC